MREIAQESSFPCTLFTANYTSSINEVTLKLMNHYGHISYYYLSLIISNMCLKLLSVQ